MATFDLGDGRWWDAAENLIDWGLGDLLGTPVPAGGGIGGGVITGQPLVGGVGPQLPVVTPGGGMPVPTTYQRPAGIIAQHQANHPGHNQYHYGDCWDPVKQRWIHKRKRRRNRLATKSDLSDLAALKGVLGGGKAFEVWIATHK